MKRILAVDDSRTCRDMTAQTLNREGYSIVLASSGSEAIKALEAGQFDLVISDLLMEDMDGIELLRRMRASERYANVPVLILTTTDSGPARSAARELKAAGWIQKPIDPLSLITIVRRVCN